MKLKALKNKNLIIIKTSLCGKDMENGTVR